MVVVLFAVSCWFWTYAGVVACLLVWVWVALLAGLLLYVVGWCLVWRLDDCDCGGFGLWFWWFGLLLLLRWLFAGLIVFLFGVCGWCCLVLVWGWCWLSMWLLCFAGIGLVVFVGACGLWLLVFVLLFVGLMVLRLLLLCLSWIFGDYVGVCSLLLMFWFGFGVFFFRGWVCGWLVADDVVCLCCLRLSVWLYVVLLCAVVFAVLVCWWLYLIAINSVVIVYFMLCYDYLDLRLVVVYMLSITSCLRLVWLVVFDLLYCLLLFCLYLGGWIWLIVVVAELCFVYMIAGVLLRFWWFALLNSVVHTIVTRTLLVSLLWFIVLRVLA